MPSFRAFERIFSLNSGLSPLVVGGVLGFVWGFSGIVDDVPSTGREEFIFATDDNTNLFFHNQQKHSILERYKL